jgi:hypothetical protein
MININNIDFSNVKLSFNNENKNMITIPTKKLFNNDGIGGYSKITTKTQAWVNEPISINTNNDKSRIKGKGKGKVVNIINPNFEKYKEIVTDEEWISRFEHAAIGKLPRGFSFKMNNNDMGGTLSYKKGNKIQRIELSPNIAEGCSECKEFFIKMGLSSTNDDMNKNMRILNNYLQQQKEHVPNKWTEYRKEKEKTEKLDKFFNNKAIEYNMNKEQKNNMIRDIYTGFYLGKITNKNIILENGYIQTITSISINNISKQIIFENQGKLKNITNKSDIKPSSPFIISWYNLLNSINNQVTNIDINSNNLNSLSGFNTNDGLFTLDTTNIPTSNNHLSESSIKHWSTLTNKKYI